MRLIHLPLFSLGCINSEMLREPLAITLKLALICFMRPLEGLAYVDAKMFHASWDVAACAINGIIE